MLISGFLQKEANVKQRIKQVLSFKKPAAAMIVIALLVCVLVGGCFMTDPKRTETPTEPVTEVTEAPTEKPTEAPPEKPTEKPTEKHTEAPTEAPTENPTEPRALDFDTVLSVGRELTGAEREKAVEFLSEGKESQMPFAWGLLQQVYSDPSEIDLSLLFYEKGTEIVRDPEEQKAVLASLGLTDIGVEPQKVRKNDAISLFRQYTGQDPTEAQMKSFESKRLYSPEYDAYFSFNNDPADDLRVKSLGRACLLTAAEAASLGITVPADEMIAVEWTAQRTAFDSPYYGMALLLFADGRYLLVSNLRFEG